MMPHLLGNPLELHSAGDPPLLPMQLIDVLALPGLPADERAHSLRVFNGLLTTQVGCQTQAGVAGCSAPRWHGMAWGTPSTTV